MDEMNKKNRKKSKFAIEILDLIRTVLICAVVVFVCTKFFFKPVRVDGDSMKPTLKDGEYGFSNVFSILNEDFSRFDVVVVNHNEDNSLWVKRIIGMPNDTVEYKNDKLYVNGKYLEENFLDKEYVNRQTNNGEIQFTRDFGPVKVKKNEVFLMGDNRLVSHDSRAVGAFEISDLLSKSVFIYFPFDEIGSVSNGTK